MEQTLITKISKAALDVGGKLKADKTNKEQNYDYLSADKILSDCGQALFTQGVVIIPDILAQEITLHEYTDAYGKAKKRYDARVDFIFHIADETTSYDAKWYGVGSDYSVPDKSLYKAITSGHKYFLMKLLCIGAGNEDAEHEEEPGEKKQAKSAPAERPNGKSAPESAPAGMTIEEAEEQFSTTANAPYGTLPTETLAKFYHGLSTTKKELTQEQAEKKAAIEIIMAARNAGRPVMAVKAIDEPMIPMI